MPQCCIYKVLPLSANMLFTSVYGCQAAKNVTEFAKSSLVHMHATHSHTRVVIHSSKCSLASLVSYGQLLHRGSQ